LKTRSLFLPFRGIMYQAGRSENPAYGAKEEEKRRNSDLTIYTKLSKIATDI
jgi:hypothetical protein